MIAKHYRLKEREVKKVLSKGKPFFSSRLVFNVFPHRLPHTRCAIVIGKKSVPNAVVRNIYRRKFYQVSSQYLEANLGDIVCVVKSKTKLSRDIATQQQFEQELITLYTKLLWKNT